MSATDVHTGAWGGDPARKQASIAAARAALAAGRAMTCIPALRLSVAGQSDDPSNVYCEAYGTADLAELEARAGLSASTLMLASAALCGCQHWTRSGEGDRHIPGLVGGTKEAPIAALEAIRVGADPFTLTRNYVVDLLGHLATVRDNQGRCLTPEQQALVRQLATLHDAGCTDPARFRELRRTATAATDAATGDLEGPILRFVESVAWPLAGLSAELPEFVVYLHFDLRSLLAPESLSPADQAMRDALWALYEAAQEQFRANPKFDIKAELERIKSTREFAAVNAPAFQARVDHSELMEAEAYAPFATDLLTGAFRKA